jgi:hypothetical protein
LHSRARVAGGEATLSASPAASAHAGKSSATLATWYVEDVERVVDELSSAA